MQRHHQSAYDRVTGPGYAPSPVKRQRSESGRAALPPRRLNPGHSRAPFRCPKLAAHSYERTDNLANSASRLERYKLGLCCLSLATNRTADSVGSRHTAFARLASHADRNLVFSKPGSFRFANDETEVHLGWRRAPKYPRTFATHFLASASAACLFQEYLCKRTAARSSRSHPILKCRRQIS